jgi:hypothetical protein
MSVAPWNGNGACLRTIMAERLPAGAYAQTIDAPPPGTYRFGVSLFAPDQAEGEAVPVEVRVVQHDAEGRELAVTRLNASVIARYRTFEGTMVRHAAAEDLTFEVSPLQTGVRVAVTGAYIAP